MIKLFHFSYFSVNLGPFSGRGCPDVRVRHAVADWVMEALAVLIILAGWVVTLAVCVGQGAPLPAETWGMQGLATLACALLLAAARMPVRFFNFPVRVSERNIVPQYLLATRLTRAFNICCCLLLVSAPWAEASRAAAVLTVASLVLMGLSLVAYYLLALKSK